jgi:hypothetical protein
MDARPIKVVDNLEEIIGKKAICFNQKSQSKKISIPKIIHHDKLISKARNIFPFILHLDLVSSVVNNEFIINYKAQILKGILYKYNNNTFLITEIHSNTDLKRNIYLVQNNKIVIHIVDVFVKGENKIISYSRSLSNIKINISPRDFEIKSFEKIIKCKFIKQVKPILELKAAKILSFDIECYLDNNMHIPYACAYYTIVDDKPIFLIIIFLIFHLIKKY